MPLHRHRDHDLVAGFDDLAGAVRRWGDVFPISSKSGRRRLKVTSPPPTMIDSVADCGRPSPPETGASSMAAPRAAASAASSRATRGAVVLMSTSTGVSRSGDRERSRPRDVTPANRPSGAR